MWRVFRAITVLATVDLGGFPTAPDCVAMRTCTTNTLGLGAVAIGQSETHPLLRAGANYWVVAEPMTSPSLMGWHGQGSAASGRAFDIGAGWMTDGESTYALRVEGTL